MNVTYRDFYTRYTDNGGSLKYEEFRKVADRLLKRAVGYIVEGKALPLAHRLGNIYLIRTKNKFRTPVIDWGSTRKEYLERKEKNLPTSGPDADRYFKFFSPDWLIKVWWDRRGVLLAGIWRWQFVPCRGLKRAVSKSVNQDEDLLYDLDKKIT